MTGKVAIEADHAAGEQLRAAAAQPPEQRLLPGPGASRDGAQHGPPGAAVSATIRSCGNGAAPWPSCAAVPVQPNIARFSGVSARFTSVD
jgi:hypothetical protein